MLKTSNDQRKLLPNFEQLFTTTAQAPGGVVRLRELILTLAVQGKLVAQDANDEPASELLKKIRVEKDRLMAEGKIKKDKPLAEIAEEEKPFELPVGWEWVPLGEVIDVIRGITFPASEKTREPAEGRIACLRTANIQHEIEWDDILYVSKDFMSREEQSLKDEDLVMSMANSRELVGKAALVRDIPTGLATFGGFLSVLRPYFLAPVYVMNVLRTSYARSDLIDSASQTTNIANISLGKLRPLAFPLPPLAEQSRIVARVEELMRLCDALEEKGRLEHSQHQQLLQALLDSLIQTTDAHELARHWQRLAQHFDLLIDRPEAVDALEQTILQLAVRGLLVPQDPSDEPASELLKKIRAEKDKLIAEGKIKKNKNPNLSDKSVEPFSLPNGWVWASFPELGEFGRGKSKHRPRNDPQLFDPPIYPLIQTGEVARAKKIINEVHSKYSDFGLAQSRLWPKGTLCITIAANIADAAILGFDACFPDSVVGFIPFAETETVNYYLAFMETAKAEISAYAPATAQKNINLEILESLRIPIPPLAEQSRIVARVTELRALCQQLRDKFTQARHTQTLLAQAWVEQVAV